MTNFKMLLYFCQPCTYENEIITIRTKIKQPVVMVHVLKHKNAMKINVSEFNT